MANDLINNANIMKLPLKKTNLKDCVSRVLRLLNASLENGVQRRHEAHGDPVGGEKKYLPRKVI
jgi:hypothetical protein